MRVIRLSGAVLAAALLVVSPLAAAGGGISGRVVDRSGDPVPGAMVRIECVEGGAPFDLVTDERGRFHAPLPGECTPRLSASLAGVAGDSTAPLDAVPGQEVELRLDLDLFADRIEVRSALARDQVSAREIRESFARDAGDAVARIPGVARLRKGGLAGDVVLRGLKGDNIAVLVDGQRLHGACPNRMDPPAFHVDFAELERIDVAKGLAETTVRGGLGGTVNLVTREPAPGFHAEIQATGGAFGYQTETANASWAGARGSVRAGLAKRRGDVYEDGDGVPFTALLPAGNPAAYRDRGSDRTAFDVETGWVHLALVPATGQRLELAFTRQDADLQLYPYLAMDAILDRADRARASWSLQRADGLLRSLAVSVSRVAVDHDMDDHLRLSSAAAAPGWSMRTETEASVWDEQLEARFRGGWTAGVDAYQRGWDATTRMVGAGGMRVMRSLPDTSLDMLAIWARHERPLTPALRLRAGARVESAAGSADPSLADTALYLAYHGTTATSHRDTYASGHLGLVWQPVPAWELSATLGRAVRPPGPEERYFALRRMGTDWVGDPGLDPAVNHQLELGLRFQGGRIAGNLDAWYSEVDGYISVVEVARQQPVPGVMNPRARSWANQDVRMWGAEASVTLDLGAGLALAATGSFTRGERDLDRARGIVDRDLAEMPAASGRLTLRWERAAWLAEAEGVAAARQERVDASLLEEATPGWAVANLRGGWQGARFSVLAGVENLFDRQYREHLSYQRDPFRSGARVPEPGRAWTVSVRWRV